MATLKGSPVKVVLVFGKSGAGKQPRIDVVVKEFRLPQLSTGNIFREYIGAFKKSGFKGSTDQFWDNNRNCFIPDAEIAARLQKAGVPAKGIDGVVLGLKAVHFVAAGKFVPDEVTNALFKAAFMGLGCSAVLDGYPRTIDQANYLFNLLKEVNGKIDFVLLVDNSDETCISRTVGRRICPDSKCGKVYHITDKPAKDGKFCKACGKEVVLRIDDTEAKIKSRLEEFHAKCEPMLKMFVNKGIPQAVVSGNLKVFSDELVHASVMGAINNIRPMQAKL